MPFLKKILSIFVRIEKQSNSILDTYVKKKPSDQNAIDIFKNEWSSNIPLNDVNIISGKARLFKDDRITWAEKMIGGFNGLNIIELGPLEAGHTYMLEKMGCKSILAIESNTKAYLKCLIVKEILNLQKTKFLLGDFVPYLKDSKEQFDVCIASGVLYHMQNPAELLFLISKTTDKILLWTHYYDKKVIENNQILSQKFGESTEKIFNGFKYTLHKYLYKDALNWSGFCGGSNPFSYWMEKEEIIQLLKKLGYNNLKIEFDDPNHQNGPSFCIMAIRK